MTKSFFPAILWISSLIVLVLSGCGGGVVGDTKNAQPVAPAITAQPANKLVTAGQTATFTVTASGTTPITYQWKKNGATVGTNSSSYTTPVTALADDGSKFSVVVTNSAGNATSTEATLTVTATPVAPAITAQPANKSVTAGQTATFNVTASGTTPLTYQWKKNGSNVGTNSSSYTTPVTVLTDNGSKFSVVVTNSAGNVTSAEATLTVTATPVAPAITAQPANKSVTVGQTATFNVTATGSTPITYQWKQNGANVGTNSSSYTTPVTVLTDNGSKFSVVVTNSAGNVTSAEATLTVTALPSGTVRIAYLHHSTGGNIWDGGVPAFFTSYNTAHGTHYQITAITYPDTGGGYPWENYPYDYWHLWVELTGASQDRGELNLDQIAANYDVIMFKHCFPVSLINADDGNPDITSSTQTIANYQLQYNALKTRMKQFPTKKFIVWTGAAEIAGATNLANAQRAQTFFNWVKTTWDVPGDNIFIWDFFALETAGAEPYMNDAYVDTSSPSHPNASFSTTVAPYIAQRIVDVIEGRGDTGSITGH